MKSTAQTIYATHVFTTLLVGFSILFPMSSIAQQQDQDLIFGNNIRIYFEQEDGTTDGTLIKRQTNGAMRFNAENSTIFTQLNYSPVTVRAEDSSGDMIDYIQLKPNGDSFFRDRVGIGTTTPDHELSVKGTIEAEEVLVQNVSGMDIVFEEDYPLRSLEETEAFINANKHLPEIASAAEMAENGVELKKFNMQLLQKIEELTLYQIALKKEIETLRALIEK